jgi:hypothetical protein
MGPYPTPSPSNWSTLEQNTTVTVPTTAITSTEPTLGMTTLAGQNATIGDLVWNDIDGNGLQDASEPGVPGASVQLLDGSGDPVVDASGYAVETTTDVDGRYALQGVVGTTYIIEFVAPGYLAFVTPHAGDDSLDSDASIESGRTDPFELTSDNPTIDAGLHATVIEEETTTVTIETPVEELTVAVTPEVTTETTTEMPTEEQTLNGNILEPMEMATIDME